MKTIVKVYLKDEHGNENGSLPPLTSRNKKRTKTI